MGISNRWVDYCAANTLYKKKRGKKSNSSWTSYLRGVVADSRNATFNRTTYSDSSSTGSQNRVQVEQYDEVVCLKKLPAPSPTPVNLAAIAPEPAEESLLMA